MDAISSPVLTKPVVIFSKIFAAWPANANLDIDLAGVACTSAALLLCLVHLYYLPGIMIDIERTLAKAKNGGISYNYILKMLFPAVVFVTSSVSKINGLWFLLPNLKRYSRRVGRVDRQLRVTADDVERCWRFSALVVSSISVLAVPINLVRLALFYRVSSGWQTVLLFANMYYQNLTSCAHEIQFATATYALVVRAQQINQRLKTLLKRLGLQLHTRYQQQGGAPREPENTRRRRSTRFFENCRISFAGSLGSRYLGQEKVAENLTELRALHKNVCDAWVSLQKAYGLDLLFSLCCLSLMLLFDIYFEFYGFIGGNAARPSSATYLWCLQYSVRFALVVQVAQKMYDEGIKTRYLISGLNNRFLDADSKEEAIAAGTTYLVILMQFHSDKD